MSSRTAHPTEPPRPAHFKGCVVCFSLSFLIEIPILNVNSVDPDQIPHFVASDLGLLSATVP